MFWNGAESPNLRLKKPAIQCLFSCYIYLTSRQTAISWANQDSPEVKPRSGLRFSRATILDRIKWEIKPPPSPQNQWWIRAQSKTRHFSIIEMGGRGGLNFSFKISKIVGAINVCRIVVHVQPAWKLRFVKIRMRLKARWRLRKKKNKQVLLFLW